VAQYSIKDVEQLTGVKAHTLRIWEQRYQAVQPHRTDTNIRFYDDEQLKFLLNVSLLMKQGRKISKIFGLSPHEMKAELNNLGSQFTSNEKYVQLMAEALVLSMIELDEAQFERIIADVTLKCGFEDCMVKVVIPFLSKVGILWATNEINVAQEHFISQLIRRKIIVAIDGFAGTTQHPKKFMLFLPEGEMHEIGLLFAHYLIKKRGHQAIYLGQSTPLDDLQKVDAIYEPDFLLTYFTVQWSNDNFESYIQKLTHQFKNRQILLCGPQAYSYEERNIGNLHAMVRVETLVNTLNNL
jgi:DNA-binding transcriptional MerR regulator